MYSFQEILGLFHLEGRSTLTDQDMKQAKNVVLKMHPDKSRLAPQYFIFYKRAFEIVVDFYQNQQRTHQAVPTQKMMYETDGKGLDKSITTPEQIHQVVEKMGQGKFQDKFNQLFEENMLNKQKIQRAQERNQWFTQEQGVGDALPDLGRGGTIHDKFNRIKEHQAATHLVKYNGVQNLYQGGGQVGRLYDDMEDGSGDGGDQDYVSSDPFGKLRYDDLRRVHKDQTVFAVGEQDLNKVTQYASFDHLQRARGQQNLTPLQEAEAKQLLEREKRWTQEQFMKKEYSAKLQAMENEEKSKAIMAQFLQLTNGR